MSRTRRTHLDSRWNFRGNFYYDDNETDYDRMMDQIPHPSPYEYLSPCSEYYINKNARDRKPWHKAASWFKVMHRKIQRANEKHAFRTGKEIPVYHRINDWNWT